MLQTSLRSALFVSSFFVALTLLTLKNVRGNPICDSLTNGIVCSSGNDYCQVYAQTYGNCNDYCSAHGQHCLRSWDNKMAQECVQGDYFGCDQSFNDQICECGPAGSPGSTVVDGHITYDGCSDTGDLKIWKVCTQDDSSHTAVARCCDFDGERCESDSANGTCSGDVNYEEAVQFCADMSRRLCSLEELQSQICCGTGCNYDLERTWTNDGCKVLPESSFSCLDSSITYSCDEWTPTSDIGYCVWQCDTDVSRELASYREDGGLRGCFYGCWDECEPCDLVVSVFYRTGRSSLDAQTSEPVEIQFLGPSGETEWFELFQSSDEDDRNTVEFQSNLHQYDMIWIRATSGDAWLAAEVTVDIQGCEYEIITNGLWFEDPPEDPDFYTDVQFPIEFPCPTY